MPASNPAPVGLRPATELAPRVLLPGDPHRALAIAQALLDTPRMFNHNRGLWGYTGTAPDGAPLTVQASGMGGPSAAIVVEELISLGARSIVRIGTCGALAGGMVIGDLIAATTVIAADGTSRALGAGDVVRPDPALTEGLLAAAGHAPRAAAVVTTDLFYDDRSVIVREWIDAGAAAVEMEAATVLQVAARRGVAAACLLGVTGLLEEGPQTAERARIEAYDLEELGVRLGSVGLEALTATERPAAPFRTR